MQPRTYIHRTELAADCRTVFDWHKQPDAFEKLNPPWINVDILSRTGGITDGGKVLLLLHFGPLPIQWELEHRNYIEGTQFQDVQLRGPFRYWCHTHSFSPSGNGCTMEDKVEYVPPLAPLSSPVANLVVAHELRKMFTYRHSVLVSQFGTP